MDDTTDNSSHRPTLRSIAKVAGVSHMTVSLALRNHPSVNKDTASRIRKIADGLGYRPDPVTAKVMSRLRFATQGSRVLAWVSSFPDPSWRTHPVYGETFRGAEERAATLGYRLDVFTIAQGGLSSRSLSRILYTRAIDGAVIGSLRQANGHISLNLENLSTVALGHTMAHPQLHRVANHQSHSVLLASRQLAKLGNLRIGFVANEALNRRVENNMLTGFLMFQTGLPENRRVPPLTPYEITFSSFRQWFLEHKPDAILGLADEIPEFLAKMKIRVPEQVHYATLDRKICDEGLAGVDQHHSLAGATAVDLLLGQIYLNERGIPRIARTVLIEGSWVDGPTAVKRETKPGRKNRGAPRVRRV